MTQYDTFPYVDAAPPLTVASRAALEGATAADGGEAEAVVETARQAAAGDVCYTCH